MLNCVLVFMAQFNLLIVYTWNNFNLQSSKPSLDFKAILDEISDNFLFITEI